MIKLRGEAKMDNGYTVRIDMNALAEFEEATGKKALTVLTQMGKGDPSIRDMRALLWACLVTAQPEITLAEAGDLLNEGGMDALLAAINAANPTDAELGGNGGKPGRKGPARK